MSNCCSCGKYIKVNVDSWNCECCEGEHHPECSGEVGGEGGEYPSETEYSICKRCCKKHNAEYKESEIGKETLKDIDEAIKNIEEGKAELVGVDEFLKDSPLH